MNLKQIFDKLEENGAPTPETFVLSIKSVDYVVAVTGATYDYLTDTSAIRLGVIGQTSNAKPRAPRKPKAETTKSVKK